MDGLLQSAWPDDQGADFLALRVHMRHLRQRLNLVRRRRLCVLPSQAPAIAFEVARENARDTRVVCAAVFPLLPGLHATHLVHTKTIVESASRLSTEHVVHTTTPKAL